MTFLDWLACEREKYAQDKIVLRVGKTLAYRWDTTSLEACERAANAIEQHFDREVLTVREGSKYIAVYLMA